MIEALPLSYVFVKSSFCSVLLINFKASRLPSMLQHGFRHLRADEIHLFVGFHHPAAQQLQELQGLDGGDGHVLTPRIKKLFPERS